MERHIGTWHKENKPDEKQVAELIIDGNSIEFYSRRTKTKKLAIF